ncbi:MAG: hypothetical protein KGL43_01960 [Burkholderiales bacterium]|nr:hypothetical protein [Burkholderiales bacterium]
MPDKEPYISIVRGLAVRLPVSSLLQAEYFYSGALKLPIVLRDEKAGVLIVGKDAFHLALVLHASDKTNSTLNSQNVVLRVPFPVNVARILEQSGGHIVRVGEPLIGGVEVVMTDPFGNTLSLWSPGG